MGYTRPESGRLAVSDDLTRLQDEVEASYRGMFGDGFIVEQTAMGPKVSLRVPPLLPQPLKIGIYRFIGGDTTHEDTSTPIFCFTEWGEPTFSGLTAGRFRTAITNVVAHIAPTGSTTTNINHWVDMGTGSHNDNEEDGFWSEEAIPDLSSYDIIVMPVIGPGPARPTSITGYMTDATITVFREWLQGASHRRLIFAAARDCGSGTDPTNNWRQINNITVGMGFTSQFYALGSGPGWLDSTEDVHNTYKAASDPLTDNVEYIHTGVGTYGLNVIETKTLWSTIETSDDAHMPIIQGENYADAEYGQAIFVALDGGLNDTAGAAASSCWNHVSYSVPAGLQGTFGDQTQTLDFSSGAEPTGGHFHLTMLSRNHADSHTSAEIAYNEGNLATLATVITNMLSDAGYPAVVECTGGPLPAAVTVKINPSYQETCHTMGSDITSITTGGGAAVLLIALTDAGHRVRETLLLWNLIDPSLAIDYA